MHGTHFDEVGRDSALHLLSPPGNMQLRIPYYCILGTENLKYVVLVLASK